MVWQVVRFPRDGCVPRPHTQTREKLENARGLDAFIFIFVMLQGKRDRSKKSEIGKSQIAIHFHFEESKKRKGMEWNGRCALMEIEPGKV